MSPASHPGLSGSLRLILLPVWNSSFRIILYIQQPFLYFCHHPHFTCLYRQQGARSWMRPDLLLCEANIQEDVSSTWPSGGRRWDGTLTSVKLKKSPTPPRIFRASVAWFSIMSPQVKQEPVFLHNWRDRDRISSLNRYKVPTSILRSTRPAEPQSISSGDSGAKQTTWSFTE